jgi:hypothetical protein
MSDGKSASEIHSEWLGRMTLRFECAFCEWQFEGGLEEGRRESEEHRSSKHPEIPPYKRRRRGGLRLSWRSELHEDEEAEVELERRKRAALHGVDLDE